jgi:hypothetical protein
MLTVKQIKKEMEAERTKLHNGLVKNAAASKRIAHLRHCQYYLETKPTEETLRRHLETVTHRVQVLSSRFGSWRAHRTGGLAEHQRQYNAETGLPQLKVQIRTLKYLLGE